jgi:signal transduction histidine kinase
VRTPLGILRSSADLLKREKQLSKEGHEVLGFMVSETERLNHLVSSLIDSARPRPLMLTVFDLADLIRHICAMLKPQAESKDIHLNVDVSHAVNVQADYNQMTQVIMNLLMNAIQVLPQGGQVLVSISESSNQVTLSIADNGAGISAENEPQIFEPFFTQRAGGVGLGLAVVRQIVQAHGGEIHYQTSRFGGADFIITLQKNSVN